MIAELKEAKTLTHTITLIHFTLLLLLLFFCELKIVYFLCGFGVSIDQIKMNESKIKMMNKLTPREEEEVD